MENDELIENVELWTNYEFSNSDLLIQAFTRKSYSVEFGGENNEVLEFIGDRVLDLVVTKALSDEFGEFTSESEFFDASDDNDEFRIAAQKDEQDFTEIKKDLVNNDNLSRIIRKHNLGNEMFLGQCDINNKVWLQPKVQADLFEAIIGAITIDCEWDMDILEDVVYEMLNLNDYLEKIEKTKKYPTYCKCETAINTLKELFEHGEISEPRYTESDHAKNLNGDMVWEATCTIMRPFISRGAYSTTKKGAKRYAAYLVLCDYYNVEPIE